MWENKLNASKAVQQAADDFSDMPTTSGGHGESAAVQHMRSVDVKPNIHHLIDPSTKAALQALPNSMYPMSSAGGGAAGASSSNSSNNPNLMVIRTKKQMAAHQVDGQADGDSSSDDDDDDDDVNEIPENQDDDDDDFKGNQDDASENEGKEDSDPLNSNDDLTEPGSPSSEHDLFDTDHVIVCQYDKITRIKNKWKFHLKDGIMNINGKDFLFSKASGDAEW